MKLLFDQNLSRGLASALEQEFPGSQHVAILGLETATDAAIWAYAADHGYAIVSKDSDFQFMSARLGVPPKVIMIQIGNRSTSDVVSLLSAHREAIRAFEKSDDSLLLLS